MYGVSPYNHGERDAMSTLDNDHKKTARLEARLTPTVYALVQHAATLQGRSISDFVVAAAQDAATAVIEQNEVLELSRADQQQFAAALLAPASPTPALDRAAAAHRDLVEPS